MSALDGPRTHGTRVRMRLAVTFAAVAAGLVLVTGWVVTGFADRWLARSRGEALERRLGRVDAEIGRIGAEVASILERLDLALKRDDPERLARLLAGGPGAVGEAARMAASTDLDVLTVLDRDETVLSSKHWPQLAGLEERSLNGLTEGRLTVRRIEAPRGEGIGVVVRRSLGAEGRSASMVGGKWLGDRFVDSVAFGFPVLLFDLQADGVAPMAQRGAQAADPVAWYDAGREDVRTVAGTEGTSWRVARRLLVDDHGREQGAVLVAVPALTHVPRQFGLLVAVIGVVAVVLAAGAGLWTASRISRPVDRLVRAVDAIAAGEADYGFPSGSEHELERLAEAFSGLQRSLELQRRRSAAAERVAAWRDAARRVAHEVKNPLVPIRLTVENLARARREDPKLFEELFDDGARTILEEVEQLHRLVTEFSEFARWPAPRPRPIDLHDVIDRTLELYAAEPGLEIDRAYGARPSRIDADPEHMGRALSNVVGNAIEAMRETGGPVRLEIRTCVEGGMVEVDVRDSGPGFPGDALGRVFEPYVTTKARGTGLGLAIVFRILTDHGGVVDAENRPEGGARVVMRLPIAADAADTADGART